jgi:RNA polymerase sigma-70 factor (ECF subfamily)
LHRARISLRDLLAPLLDPRSEAEPAPSATCPDVLTLFSKHLEDEISQDLCEQMERHLAACERCRGVCDSLKRTLSLCRTSGASAAVPSAVQTQVKVALRDFLAESA